MPQQGLGGQHLLQGRTTSAWRAARCPGEIAVSVVMAVTLGQAICLCTEHSCSVL